MLSHAFCVKIEHEENYIYIFYIVHTRTNGGRFVLARDGIDSRHRYRKPYQSKVGTEAHLAQVTQDTCVPNVLRQLFLLRGGIWAQPIFCRARSSGCGFRCKDAAPGILQA